MLRRAIRLLMSDPAAFGHRLARWLTRRLMGRWPFPSRWTVTFAGVRFGIDLRLDPRMRQMALGDYERTLLRVVARFIRPGDVVIDVGANVGYVTARVLGMVATQGEVHAFEPVPRYFERLERVRVENPAFRLRTSAVALGSAPGVARIAVTNLPNIGWNTMVPGFMSSETIDSEVEVPVTTLDVYVADHAIDRLRLVKIDTEGYELPVIRGFTNYLRTAREQPVLIVEVAPGAYPRLGATLGDLAALMGSLDYRAFGLDLAREIDVTRLNRTTDIAFLPPWAVPPAR